MPTITYIPNDDGSVIKRVETTLTADQFREMVAHEQQRSTDAQREVADLQPILDQVNQASPLTPPVITTP